jgi:hypothetical protein
MLIVTWSALDRLRIRILPRRRPASLMAWAALMIEFMDSFIARTSRRLLLRACGAITWPDLLVWRTPEWCWVRAIHHLGCCWIPAAALT